MLSKDFARCNADALAGYSGERAKLYASLKLAGLDEAPLDSGVHVPGAGIRRVIFALDVNVGLLVEQQPHCSQDHIGSLVGGQLAEETETVPESRLSSLGERRNRQTPVFLVDDLLGRDAPVHIAIAQEPARRQEQVDMCEV